MYPAHMPIPPLDTPIIPNTLSDIRAMTSLNTSDNSLGGYCDIDDDGSWVSDMSGVQALAAAIPECK
jgi:hypothetical protein